MPFNYRVELFCMLPAFCSEHTGYGTKEALFLHHAQELMQQSYVDSTSMLYKHLTRQSHEMNELCGFQEIY
jgi:hypothetical protein